MQIDILFVTLVDVLLFIIRKSSKIPTIVFLTFPMIILMCMVGDCKLTMLSSICLIISDVIGLICIEIDKKGKD